MIEEVNNSSIFFLYSFLKLGEYFLKLIFLIPSSTIRSTTKKTIKSVVGGQERLDVLSRCLLNLSRWNNRINGEFQLLVYMSHEQEQKVLSIPISDKFDTLQNEIDSTYMMLDVLSSPKEYNAEYRVIRFNKLLDNLTRDSSIFYLTSEGLSFDKQKVLIQNNLSLCFILGSQHDLSDEQEKALCDIKYIPISLGEKDYLASHVITIVCNHLSHLDDN